MSWALSPDSAKPQQPRSGARQALWCQTARSISTPSEARQKPVTWAALQHVGPLDELSSATPPHNREIVGQGLS